jgi:hypothetical protein
MYGWQTKDGGKIIDAGARLHHRKLNSCAVAVVCVKPVAVMWIQEFA